MNKITSFLAIVVAISATQALSADVVNFSTPFDIGVAGQPADDQTFVNTTGAEVLAVNFTDVSEVAFSQNVTVNGVFFNELGAVDTANTQTFTDNGVSVSISGDGTFRDDANSFGGVPASLGYGFDVTELLNSAYLEVDTIEFTGLTPGDEYLVQFFVHDNRNNNQNDVTTFTTAGGNTATVNVINDGLTGTGLAIGETVTGTFTAVSGTVTILVDGTDDVVNAVQLRNITTSTIPEPGSLALLASFGALGLIRRRR